jgi:pimeloyl-ACP methyl ester carboxylesterase
MGSSNLTITGGIIHTGGDDIIGGNKIVTHHGDADAATQKGRTDTIVVLIHGIRTRAWWQKSVAPIVEEETGATVIPLKYGYLDLFRFLCPFGICRDPPIERLRKQIEGVREQFKGYRLVVFAHSYGSYALSRILLDNPYFTFHRIILCGSIIPEDYDWRRVDNQILASNKRDAVINECGIKDVWPVLARFATWGYGASGTYGFGTFNVRDRYHPNRHSDFFKEIFIRKFWVPAVAGTPIDFSETDRSSETAPWWFGLFRLPIRWLAPIAAIAILSLIAFATDTGWTGWCTYGKALYGRHCVKLDALDDIASPCPRRIAYNSRQYDLKAVGQLLNIDYANKSGISGQISDVLQLYFAQAEDLCHLHRSGTITNAQYADKIRELENKFSKLIMLGQIEPSDGPQEEISSYREVLDKLKTNNNALGSRNSSLNFQVTVGGKPIQSGAILHSGDVFKVKVRLQDPAFLYVLLLDSTRKLHRLYPSRPLDPNPVEGLVVIPAADNEFLELDNEPGTEELYIFAQAEKSELIETGLAALTNERSDKAIELLNGGLRARGVFVTTRDADPSGGSNVQSEIGLPAAHFKIVHM